MKAKQPKITEVRPAGSEHQVVTVVGGKGTYCRTPCSDCPWRKDAVGKFPAEAFRHSANTAYDMSTHTFGCHQSGADKPATCAGFLLKGSVHNLSTRFALMERRVEHDKVHDGGVELFDSYKEMAVANGVAPDDPILEKCRS